MPLDSTEGQLCPSIFFDVKMRFACMEGSIPILLSDHQDIPLLTWTVLCDINFSVNSSFHCPICSRCTPPEKSEDHHAKPKCRGGKETFTVCIDCGDMLHKLFTNKELDKLYRTTEAILSDPRARKWRNWVKDKPFGVCMKTKKRR